MPLPPTPEGTLMPCGENVPGTILEFFVHPATAAEILADPVQTLRDSTGGTRRYRFVLLDARYGNRAGGVYGNGDVQLRAMEIV